MLEQEGALPRDSSRGTEGGEAGLTRTQGSGVGERGQRPKPILLSAQTLAWPAALARLHCVPWVGTRQDSPGWCVPRAGAQGPSGSIHRDNGTDPGKRHFQPAWVYFRGTNGPQGGAERWARAWEGLPRVASSWGLGAPSAPCDHCLLGPWRCPASRPLSSRGSPLSARLCCQPGSGPPTPR